MTQPTPPAAVAIPGDPAAAYRHKVSTRSSDQGVQEGEKVLASCVSKPWWSKGSRS